MILALNQRQANIALGLAPGSRWLDDAPLEWIDMRKPGGKNPVKRWSIRTLELFLLDRTVQPGHVSPFT